MAKFILILIFSALITFPLTSIDGFTYWAWVSIALLLTINHLNRLDESSNLYKSIMFIGEKIDNLSSKIDAMTTLVRRNASSDDAVNQKILDELIKIRKTVRHETKK